MPLLPTHDPAILRRRKALSHTWLVATVTWSFVRTLILWATMGDYGLDPRAYMVIDLTSAVINGFTTPHMVIAFIDDRYKRATRWASISLAAFIVPDLFVFLGTRALPSRIVVVFVGIVTLTLGLAVWGVVRKVVRGRSTLVAVPVLGADLAPQT